MSAFFIISMTCGGEKCFLHYIPDVWRHKMLSSWHLWRVEKMSAFFIISIACWANDCFLSYPTWFVEWMSAFSIVSTTCERMSAFSIIPILRGENECSFHHIKELRSKASESFLFHIPDVCRKWVFEDWHARSATELRPRGEWFVDGVSLAVMGVSSAMLVVPALPIMQDGFKVCLNVLCAFSWDCEVIKSVCGDTHDQICVWMHWRSNQCTDALTITSICGGTHIRTRWL